MTLHELSIEYSQQADILHAYLLQLRQQEATAPSETERMRIHDRVRILSAMWRDTRDIAVLTEHYYERGRCRNAKYII